MDVRIVGRNMPGRTWAGYDNVYVGVQRRTEVVDLFPGDAPEAVWEFSVDVSSTHQDLSGPYVQGRRGDRFFYLSWGTVDASGAFTMFRRAKLLVGAIDRTVIEAAKKPGYRLLATVTLTGGDGGPRCAAVRPPAINWTAASAD